MPKKGFRTLITPILLCFIFACGTEPIKKPLTISEQIKVDTKSAEGLSSDFKKQVTFLTMPQAEKFLTQMAQKILKQTKGLEGETIAVKIHDDSQPKLQRFFSFPGTLISVPASFLQKVEFENELAAALAFEIANVMDRFLAQKVEAELAAGQSPKLFGKGSVFELKNRDRVTSIKVATSLMYAANYDTRGMASIFKHYPGYYVQDSTSDLIQKTVDFNIREAQRAKSEFLPQMKPIVRSGEFIQFKKDLNKKRS